MRYRLVLVGLVALAAVGCGPTTDDSAVPPARPDETAAMGPEQSTTTMRAESSASPETSAEESDQTGGDDDVSSSTTTTNVPITPSTLDGSRTTAAATEDDPVPVGEVVELTGLWDLSVTEVDFDAADVITEFADINPAPEEGTRYVLITVEGVYLGERVAQPAFEWAVSDGDVEYLPAIPGCGVVPDSIYDVTEIAAGEAFKANICVPVDEDSIAKGLTLFLQPLGDEARYFELG